MVTPETIAKVWYLKCSKGIDYKTMLCRTCIFWPCSWRAMTHCRVGQAGPISHLLTPFTNLTSCFTPGLCCPQLSTKRLHTYKFHCTMYHVPCTHFIVPCTHFIVPCTHLNVPKKKVAKFKKKVAQTIVWSKLLTLNGQAVQP